MYISPQKSFVIFIVGLSPTIAVKNSTKKILRIKATKGRPLFVSVRYCIYRLDSIYGFIFFVKALWV